jgi:outer membrane assembly lipoprotein YfiO
MARRRQHRPFERARRGRLPIWVLCLAGLLCACASAPRPVPLAGAEGDFARAKSEYDRGRMLEAITLLEAFEKEHPGSQYIDDALYLLGKAHQANKEQILARQAFQRLLDDYPRSPFAEDALFEVAYSWFLSVRGPALDPEPAEEALRSFRTYLGRYPEGKYRDPARGGEQAVLGTLAKKDCLNGETYMKLRRYPAARRYFEKSLERWNESPVSARALAGIARSYEKEGSAAEARAAYERLLAHLGDDPARYQQGEELARRARQRLAGTPPSGS